MDSKYHWRDGWYFGSDARGNVTIYQGDDQAVFTPVIGPIHPNEWASIIASVSEQGENAFTWRLAKTFHEGGLAPLRAPGLGAGGGGLAGAAFGPASLGAVLLEAVEFVTVDDMNRADALSLNLAALNRLPEGLAAHLEFGGSVADQHKAFTHVGNDSGNLSHVSSLADGRIVVGMLAAWYNQSSKRTE